MSLKNKLFFVLLATSISATAQRLYSPAMPIPGSSYPLRMWVLDPVTNAISLDSVTGPMQSSRLIPCNPLCQYQGAFYGVSWLEASTMNDFLIYRYVPDSQHMSVVCQGALGMIGLMTTAMVESGGKLYGIVRDGGNNGVGKLFMVDPATGTFDRLHHFNLASGSKPIGLICVENTLYGIVREGGTYGKGGIFSYTPATGQYQLLHAFQSPDGKNPQTIAVMGNSLIGFAASEAGGSSVGPVCFSYDLATGTFTNRGFIPYAGNVAGTLLLDQQLYFFQATQMGAWHTAADTVTIHKQFTCQAPPCPDGYTPLYGVGPVRWGNSLYGLLEQGGTNDHGLAFAWDLANGSYTVLKNFSNTAGFIYTQWVLFDQTLAADQPLQAATVSLYPNPAHSQVTFSVPPKLLGAAVTLSSLAGERLRTWPAQSLQTIEIEGLPSGIYLLKVGEQAARLVVK